MALILKCSEIVPYCDFVVRGETEGEILRRIQEHIRSAHDMDEITEKRIETLPFFIRLEKQGESRLLQEEAA